ncbi:hypothetical protein V1514DRAFT_334102 [Lipomyces japonicus]|uniref:uncharacterized protein n=1 Tax=Lipomyces japonicus TaxID=56871 RepID=UPI0034CE9221
MRTALSPKADLNGEKKNGILVAIILKARRLKHVTQGQQPYCICSVGEITHRTNLPEATTSSEVAPVWDAELRFDIYDTAGAAMLLRVFDHQPGRQGEAGKGDEMVTLLGECSIDIKPAMRVKPIEGHDGWYPLYLRNEHDVGEVFVELSYYPVSTTRNRLSGPVSPSVSSPLTDTFIESLPSSPLPQLSSSPFVLNGPYVQGPPIPRRPSRHRHSIPDIPRSPALPRPRPPAHSSSPPVLHLPTKPQPPASLEQLFLGPQPEYLQGQSASHSFESQEYRRPGPRPMPHNGSSCNIHHLSSSPVTGNHYQATMTTTTTMMMMTPSSPVNRNTHSPLSRLSLSSPENVIHSPSPSLQSKKIRRKNLPLSSAIKDAESIRQQSQQHEQVKAEDLVPSPSTPTAYYSASSIPIPDRLASLHSQTGRSRVVSDKLLPSTYAPEPANATEMLSAKNEEFRIAEQERQKLAKIEAEAARARLEGRPVLPPKLPIGMSRAEWAATGGQP